MPPENNKAMAPLFIEPDVSNLAFGLAHPFSEGDIGNVLLTDPGGGNLALEDVKALYQFCCDELQPMLQERFEGRRTKKEVADFINSSNFLAFKEKLRVEEKI